MLPTLVSAGAVVALGDASGAWVNVITALEQVSHLSLQAPVGWPRR